MNETPSTGSSGGIVRALHTLRHALADPLSAAGMKLELIDRRLGAASPDAPALSERVRGAKSDLLVAGRLINLLPRLASIAGEGRSEASLDDLCRVAGLGLEPTAEPGPHLLLRRLATIDALGALGSFLRAIEPGSAALRAFAENSPDRVSLRIETSGVSVETTPERLFHLPRGDDKAEELFLARAGVESDGGSLELENRDGRIVAILSWPRPAPPDAGERR